MSNDKVPEKIGEDQALGNHFSTGRGQGQKSSFIMQHETMISPHPLKRADC